VRPYSVPMAAESDPQSVPRDQGISLQELSEAFARAIGAKNQPGNALPEPGRQAAGPEAPGNLARVLSVESPKTCCDLGVQANCTAQEVASPPDARLLGHVPKADTSGATWVPAGVSDARAEAAETAELSPYSAAIQLDAVADPCPINPRTILEALLFVGSPQGTPLGVQEAADLMRGVSAEEIPGLVDELNERYRKGGCPYEVIRDGPGYRMALRKEFSAISSKFDRRLREARLSQAAIEVAAIVAYRQPVTADEINRLRGKASNHVLANLVRRQLLRVERTSEEPRKTFYHTTDRFLALFGMASLADLPRSEELDKQ